ncbi:hypothetical protein [Microcystis aeruginosa]|uniref:hypothetical protein n=1 Tax=Microcystis aeruginosa TaxID=1126 RepID=UPI00232F2687|nr:hypothetical protein [Microcystis aeruginosa]MDB9418235.1 hypothetical protein [Microcystis aeruginosa CS-556/03]
MSIVSDLERTNQLSLLPDKDLADLCPPIEPYQVTKNHNFWQQAITQARQLICHDRVKDDLAPNILGGLVGLLATSGNPVLVVVATPLAIHVVRETLDNFCD